MRKKFNRFSKIFLILLITNSSLTSCAYIFYEVATPNSCKKCQVIDSYNYAVWTEDNCGGGVFNMELRAKAEAYELGCGFRVSCFSYDREQ